MCGPAAQKMLHLQAAGKAGGDYCGRRGGLPKSRKKALLAYQAGDFVVFFFVTEGTGHPAAAGIEIGHLRTRNAA